MKHSLRAFFTASSGSNFPEVVAVALINDVQAGYCDSKIKTALPKQDWMENLRDGDPEYWRLYTHECTVHQQIFKEEFHILKQRLNKTGSMTLFCLVCSQANRFHFKQLHVFHSHRRYCLYEGFSSFTHLNTQLDSTETLLRLETAILH